MLFHGIAKGNLFVNKNEVPSSGEEEKKEPQQPFILDQWEKYFAPMKWLNPDLKWGQFLPQRVRKLLLNLSRYNF